MSKPSQRQQRVNETRRRILKASALGAATAAPWGAAPFFGPWKHNHVWSQAAQKKPLVIGLTMDASGQYGASGGMERLGRDDGDQGVQRQGRRAGAAHRGAAHGHGDDAGDRLGASPSA